MSISTAPRQGDGQTVRPPPEGVDSRLIALGVLGLITGLLVVVAATTIDYVDVKVQGAKIGDMNLWRVNLNRDAIESIGVTLEDDALSPKAIITNFLSENKRHKQINEDIISNTLLCTTDDARQTCENLRTLSRMFVQSQGKLLPSASMLVSVLFVIPIHTMRCANQALVLAVISFIAFVNIIATVANLVHNLDDRVGNVFKEAFPGVNVDTEWTAGAIVLFVAAGSSGVFFLLNTMLYFVTRSDPYSPCDGPNFSDDNPMPVHFPPIHKRAVQPPTPTMHAPIEHPTEDHNAPYGGEHRFSD